jgi:hypothetical protein
MERAPVRNADVDFQTEVATSDGRWFEKGGTGKPPRAPPSHLAAPVTRIIIVIKARHVRACLAMPIPFLVEDPVMYRIVSGLLVLFLALPVLGNQDKTKNKPMTPQEQYKALLKEQDDSMEAFQDVYQKAKTQEERDKVVKEKYPNSDKLAPKMLELAEKHPKDLVAVDALVWVVTNTTDACPH